MLQKIPAMKPLKADDVLGHVIDAYRQIFPDDAIDTESDFFDLGGDSLAVVSFCACLEEKFGREIHPSIIIYFPTVEDLAGELTAQFGDKA